MAINIDVVADVDKVIGPVGQMADAYDEVSDTLKDLAKAGDQAAGKLERSLEDGGDAARKLDKDLDKAEDAAEKLGRSGKDAGKDLERGLKDGEDAAKDLDRKADQAFDSISDNARKSSRKVASDTKEGFRDAARASDEFKDETRANLSETVSSFRGDMEDLPQIAQDVLGGVSANLGAIGGALTVGLAAAIGVSIGKLQELAEKNTEVKEGIAELGREIYDAGGELSAADLDGKIADIAFALAQEDVWWKWGDQAKTNIGMVKDALGDLDNGDAGRDAFRGLAGDLEAAARAQDRLASANEESERALQSHIETTVDGVTYYDAEGRAIKSTMDARNELSKKIEEQTGITQGANDEVAYYTQLMGESASVTEDATAALEARASALAENSSAAMDLTSAENDYIETLGQMTKDIAANGAQLDINTEAGRANRESLVDIASAANKMRDAQIEAGASTQTITSDAQAAREAFIAAAEAAGYNTEGAKALADSYGLIPENVETLVQANGTDEAKAAVDAVAEPTEAPVDVTTNGTEATAQAGVDSVTGGTAEVTVTAGPTPDEVQGRIDAIKGRDVEIDVQDFDSVRNTQRRIDGLKGKDVPITVSIANLAAIQSQLDALTLPRTVWVTVNERAGVKAP